MIGKASWHWDFLAAWECGLLSSSGSWEADEELSAFMLISPSDSGILREVEGDIWSGSVP